MVMFVTLALLLFSGYPVAFILGGLAMFWALRILLRSFTLIEYFNLFREYGGKLVKTSSCSSTSFRFMGVMTTKWHSKRLLYCVQVLLKRVPGALALAVTVMGTILAAMTGIIERQDNTTALALQR